MTRTIVLDEHTLGVIYPNGLQILHTSILRGSPIQGDPLSAMGVLAFDPVLMANRFRPATEQDFTNFRVAFHPDYLKNTGIMDT